MKKRYIVFFIFIGLIITFIISMKIIKYSYIKNYIKNIKPVTINIDCEYFQKCLWIIETNDNPFKLKKFSYIKDFFIPFFLMDIPETNSINISSQTARLILLDYYNHNTSINWHFTNLFLTDWISKNLDYLECLNIITTKYHFGLDKIGVQNASKVIFNKEVNNLNIEEISYLIALYRSPVLFNKDEHSENAKKMINIIKNKLNNSKYL